MAEKEWITTDIAKERTKKINIVGRVASKGESRDINLKAGGQTKVCKCKLIDPKGELDLQLWGEEVTKVNEGDIVRISNAYMNEYQGQKSLNVGKYGNLEVVEQASA